MSKPRSAAERVRQRRLLHENGTINRVDLILIWPKKNIDSFCSAKLFIGGFRPWISRKIGARLELQRIHKNADRYFAITAGLFARRPNERDMTPVQCSHRWHKHAASRARAHMVIRC